jgi:hypothetical protein
VRGLPIAVAGRYSGCGQSRCGEGRRVSRVFAVGCVRSHFGQRGYPRTGLPVRRYGPAGGAPGETVVHPRDRARPAMAQFRWGHDEALTRAHQVIAPTSGQTPEQRPPNWISHSHRGNRGDHPWYGLIMEKLSIMDSYQFRRIEGHGWVGGLIVPMQVGDRERFCGPSPWHRE